MKISKFLIALVFGAALVSCSHYGENHHEVPQSAKNAFMKGYPGATNAKWEKDGDMYKVEFTYNYADYEVTYDKGGYIVEIEYGIDTKYLPEGVLAKVEAKHPGKKIEAKHVEYRRFAFFEVEISEDTHHVKGDEHTEEGHEIEMFFSVSGKEFDGEKKVACIEKCKGSLCTPQEASHTDETKNELAHGNEHGDNHNEDNNGDDHGDDHTGH